MNWHNVVVQLQAEASRAFEEAQRLTEKTSNPEIDAWNLVGAQIKAAQGDIIRSFAAALIKGLDPRD